MYWILWQMLNALPIFEDEDRGSHGSKEASRGGHVVW